MNGSCDFVRFVIYINKDLPQIFHGLVVDFKTIFYSLVYKCYLWDESRQSSKSIAKFLETLFQTNFLVNNLNLLYFLKNELLQLFEQIVRTEFHSLLKFPHRYQQQELRD